MGGCPRPSPGSRCSGLPRGNGIAEPAREGGASTGLPGGPRGHAGVCSLLLLSTLAWGHALGAHGAFGGSWLGSSFPQPQGRLVPTVGSSHLQLPRLFRSTTSANKCKLQTVRMQRPAQSPPVSPSYPKSAAVAPGADPHFPGGGGRVAPALRQTIHHTPGMAK